VAIEIEGKNKTKKKKQNDSYNPQKYVGDGSRKSVRRFRKRRGKEDEHVD